MVDTSARALPALVATAMNVATDSSDLVVMNVPRAPRNYCALFGLLAIEIGAIDVAILVVVDVVVSDLVVAVVDQAVAVIVDAVAADFLGHALAAAVLVGRAVAIVVQRVATDVHAAALGIVGR